MKLTHGVETWLVRWSMAFARRKPWPASLAAGVRLGDLAWRLGIRRKTAEENLARAFPELGDEARAGIIRSHYHELGRVWAEYARLAELARAPRAEVFVHDRGLENLERTRDSGRGAILLTGHYGSFELAGAALARFHPVDVVVKPLSNPGAEAMLARSRRDAGVGAIPLGTAMRGAYRSLRAGHWVAMVADQDAGRRGIFVPFLGRPASTALGPAQLSIRTGAPIVMGFATRRDDGRMEMDFEPPMLAEDPEHPDAAAALTARHVARLEWWVRRNPAMWFWLHRRWKTRPEEEAL
jgi:KDO2-lipid IV(A) lauroyltransferase